MKTKLKGDKLKIAKLKEKLRIAVSDYAKYAEWYEEEKAKVDKYEREEREERMCLKTARNVASSHFEQEIRFLKHIIRVYAKDPTLKIDKDVIEQANKQGIHIDLFNNF